MVGPIIGQGDEWPPGIAAVYRHADDTVPGPADAPEGDVIKRLSEAIMNPAALPFVGEQGFEP